MAKLDMFDNFQIVNRIAFGGPSGVAGSLAFYGFELPGSISMNTLAVAVSAFSATTSKGFTMSVGLFSRNGSTLTLVNSALLTLSGSTSSTSMSWYSFTLSATSFINPGNWYWGVLYSSAGADVFGVANGALGLGVRSPIGGSFVHGKLSVTTATLPASVATSDLQAFGSTGVAFTERNAPYIVISA